MSDIGNEKRNGIEWIPEPPRPSEVFSPPSQMMTVAAVRAIVRARQDCGDNSAAFEDSVHQILIMHQKTILESLDVYAKMTNDALMCGAKSTLILNGKGVPK